MQEYIYKKNLDNCQFIKISEESDEFLRVGIKIT